MQVIYCTNLVILGFQVHPVNELNIKQIQTDHSSEAHLYRGAVIHRKKEYTLRITRNAFCSVYLKQNLSKIISNIEALASDINCFLETYYLNEVTSIDISIRNIQITFSIIFNGKTPRFVEFCRGLAKFYNEKYNFEVKESGSNDSVWLQLNSSCSYFSGFRMKYRDNPLTVFNYSHTYKGSCLTRNVLHFLDICNDIKTFLPTFKVVTSN